MHNIYPPSNTALMTSFRDFCASLSRLKPRKQLFIPLFISHCQVPSPKIYEPHCLANSYQRHTPSQLAWLSLFAWPLRVSAVAPRDCFCNLVSSKTTIALIKSVSDGAIRPFCHSTSAASAGFLKRLGLNFYIVRSFHFVTVNLLELINNCWRLAVNIIFFTFVL